MQFKSTALKLWEPNGDVGFRVSVTDIGSTLVTPNDGKPLSIPHHMKVGHVSFLDTVLNNKLDEISETLDEILNLLENPNGNQDLPSPIDFGKELNMLRKDVSFINKKLSITFPGN